VTTSAAEIPALLERLDGSGSKDEWEAVSALRALGSQTPALLLQRYRVARKWQARSSCVYHAMRYARESEDAVTLGREALRDRSGPVRYRACMLLAYSLRRDLLNELREQLIAAGPRSDRDDLRAAIDAIENGNANYFVDRDHSGKVTLTIG
jgi:hypothetical protein